MKGGHGLVGLIINYKGRPFSMKFGDAIIGTIDVVGGSGAQKQDFFRIYQFDLTIEEWAADLAFFDGWVAVAWRAPIYQVGDVGVFMGMGNCF